MLAAIRRPFVLVQSIKGIICKFLLTANERNNSVLIKRLSVYQQIAYE